MQPGVTGMKPPTTQLGDDLVYLNYSHARNERLTLDSFNAQERTDEQTVIFVVILL